MQLAPAPAPVPVHLTEEEINARIAKAVELEVARRLEEREKQRREEEAAEAARRQSMSMQEEQTSSLQSLPPGLLTPLLKQRQSHDEELKQRLEELESKLYVHHYPQRTQDSRSCYPVVNAVTRTLT